VTLADALVRTPASSPVSSAPRRGDVYDRARAYLAAMPEAVSGSGGHTATWNAARKLADFGLSESEILSMLEHEFNPRCVPPWSRRELEHKASDAYHRREHRPIAEREPARQGHASEPDDERPATEHPRREAWPTIDVAGIFGRLEPIRYLVAGLDLCAGAPALLAGYGYSGKTLAAQAAALAIAAGLPVWGAFAARQGRVLHVDYEQGQRLTRERYQRLALGLDVGPSDLGDRLTLVSMPSIYLDGADHMVERLAGYDLAIIDSYRAACPRIDENDSTARQPLDALTRASEATGCAVIVVHHARKPSRDAAGGTKMAVRGSGAIYDACASVLVFEAERGQPVRVSHEKARVSGRTTEDFELVIDDVEVGGEPRAGVLVSARTAPSRAAVADAAQAERRRQRTAQVADQVRELFRGEPEHGGADALAAKLGLRVTDVRAALAMLVGAGEVLVSGTSRDRRHRWAGA
jgi:hypothetical protein